MQAKRLGFLVLGLGAVALALAALGAPVQASTDLLVTVQPPAGANGVSIPSYQIVTPAPGTNSVLVQQPVSGSGIPRYQIVFLGPNPAQNTALGIAQQLQLGAPPGTHVTVQAVP